MASNYPTYKLGEVIDKVAIASKVKQKEYLADGKFPIIDQGQNLIGGYTNDEKLLVNAELPVIVFGDHTKVKKYINFPFVAGADGTKIIKPKKEFFSEPKLFYYFLHCLKFPDKGYARHFQYLLKSDISVPPLATQRAIVTRIESLFAELDKGVEKLKTAQQQLKVYRQAVLNDCLTKGSEKWEKVKLGEVAEIVTGNTPSKKDMSLYGNDYPFFKPTDLNAGINTIQAEDNVSIKGFNMSRKLPIGSILVTCIGATIGKTGLIHREGICNQQINAVLPNNSFVPKYMYYFVISDFFQRQIKTNASATTLPILNKSKFSSLYVFLPSLPIQQRIVQEVETRLSACDEVEKNINESLQQSEALRQSILKKAFSGELV